MYLLKKKKFENTKLSADILDAVAYDDNEEANDSVRTKQKKQTAASDKIKKQIAKEGHKGDSLNDTTFSDFIPLKTFS